MGIAASRQPVCLKHDIDLSMISLHQKSYPRSCSAPRPPESTESRFSNFLCKVQLLLAVTCILHRRAQTLKSTGQEELHV
ncbi:hypothetical protein DY000_02046704 [Brassica cretica]|uniref:Uncharacterized protein n=1 Tax=Brassica cretica TaxID=69181 RepID=A0ABQ7F7A5_BRACR|nr:hypothetical protein DY000_02046704 [Brassica cretica]